MGYFFLLAYCIAFAISDCLWLFVKKETPLLYAMLIRSIVTVFLITSIYLLTKYNVINWGLTVKYIDNIDLYLSIFSSALSYSGLYFFIKSLKICKVGITVIVVSALSTTISLLFAVMIYNEPFTLTTLFFIIVLLTGVYFCKDNLQNKLMVNQIKKGYLYAIFAAISWGISYSLFKGNIEKVGALNFSLILESTVLAISIILFALKLFYNIKIEIVLKSDLIYLFFIGILVGFGTLSNAIVYNYFTLITITVLNKLSLILPFLFAFLFFKQKPEKLQYIGIVLILGANIFYSIIKK